MQYAFVIATKTEENAQALARRAHFVFRRPLNIDEIKHACRSAYDFMLDESRRYFRKNASLSVKIAGHKTIFESSTLNISANGMAVRTLVPLDLAATVELEFALPDGFRIHGSGLVVWHDPEGNSGLRFHCSEPEMRDRLDSWLCSEFQKNEIR